MGSDDLLLLLSASIIVILLIMIVYTNMRSRKNYMNQDEKMLLERSNMRRTNLDGKRLGPQQLPELGAGRFMYARYQVIANDSIGDETEPLSDLCIAGFKNPGFEHGRQKPLFTDANWSSERSTPNLDSDDTHLHHSAAEMVTPEHRVKIAKKTEHFLPYTGGKSRLNFSSFENSHNEEPFRQ